MFNGNTSKASFYQPGEQQRRARHRRTYYDIWGNSKYVAQLKATLEKKMERIKEFVRDEILDKLKNGPLFDRVFGSIISSDEKNKLDGLKPTKELIYILIEAIDRVILADPEFKKKLKRMLTVHVGYHNHHGKVHGPERTRSKNSRFSALFQPSTFSHFGLSKPVKMVGEAVIDFIEKSDGLKFFDYVANDCADPVDKHMYNNIDSESSNSKSAVHYQPRFWGLHLRRGRTVVGKGQGTDIGPTPRRVIHAQDTETPEQIVELFRKIVDKIRPSDNFSRSTNGRKAVLRSVFQRRARARNDDSRSRPLIKLFIQTDESDTDSLQNLRRVFFEKLNVVVYFLHDFMKGSCGRKIGGQLDLDVSVTQYDSLEEFIDSTNHLDVSQRLIPADHQAATTTEIKTREKDVYFSTEHPSEKASSVYTGLNMLTKDNHMFLMATEFHINCRAREFVGYADDIVSGGFSTPSVLVNEFRTYHCGTKMAKWLFQDPEFIV